MACSAQALHCALGPTPGTTANECPQEELGTPALAFARAVCEVLGLDAAVEAEVAVLRRNLLRLAHTREFAPAAAFKACTCLCPVAMFACCAAARRARHKVLLAAAH